MHQSINFHFRTTTKTGLITCLSHCVHDVTRHKRLLSQHYTHCAQHARELHHNVYYKHAKLPKKNFIQICVSIAGMRLVLCWLYDRCNYKPYNNNWAFAPAPAAAAAEAAFFASYLTTGWNLFFKEKKLYTPPFIPLLCSIYQQEKRVIATKNQQKHHQMTLQKKVVYETI